MPQNQGNITVVAEANVALPGIGEYTLFFDSANLLTLTSVSNEAGVRVVKTYGSGSATSLYKGLLDASTNPNYPAAVAGGEYYIISVSGKVGGALGKVVSAGDLLIANAPNPGGTEAAVGTFWEVYQNAFNLPLATKVQAYAGLSNAVLTTPYSVRSAIQGGALMTSAAIQAAPNVYTVAFNAPIQDYTAGSVYEIYFSNPNTGNSTLNLDGLGALTCYKADPNIAGTYRLLVSGDIKIGYSRFVYDAIANGFVLISRAGDMTQQANAVYVDAVFGSDLTAQKYNPLAPYLTLEAANAAAVSGDTVIVLPGSYSLLTSLGKNGVNWYFNIGAIVNGAGSIIFTDTAGIATYNVSGYGTFINSGNRIVQSFSGSTIQFEYDNIISDDTAFQFDAGGTLIESGKTMFAYKAFKLTGNVQSSCKTNAYIVQVLYDVATNAVAQNAAFSFDGYIQYNGIDATPDINSICKSASFAGDGSDLTVTVNGYINIPVSGIAQLRVFEGYATCNAEINIKTTTMLFGDDGGLFTTIDKLVFNNKITSTYKIAVCFLASVFEIDFNADVTGSSAIALLNLSGVATSKVNVKGLLKNNGVAIGSGGITKNDGAGSGDFVVQLLPTARIVLTAAAIGAGAESIAGAVVSVTYNNYPGSSTNAPIGGTVVEQVATILVDANVE